MEHQVRNPHDITVSRCIKATPQTLYTPHQLTTRRIIPCLRFLVSENYSGNAQSLSRSLRVVAEQELIAKWNGGDYSAEGWVEK